MIGDEIIKIIVLVKEIFDTNQQIDLDKRDKLEKTINLHDEHALEEAIRLKEKFGGEVIIYTVGDRDTRKTMNYYMAMGADRVELVISKNKEAKNVAVSLVQTIEEKDADFDMILGGFNGIDYDRGEVPGRVSVRLDIPFINMVTKIEVEGKRVRCKRELENKEEIIEGFLPAIITVQRGINTPRFPDGRSIFMDKSSLILERETDINYSTLSREVVRLKKEKNVEMIEGKDSGEKIENLIKILKAKKLL